MAPINFENEIKEINKTLKDKAEPSRNKLLQVQSWWQNSYLAILAHLLLHLLAKIVSILISLVLTSFLNSSAQSVDNENKGNEVGEDGGDDGENNDISNDHENDNEGNRLSDLQAMGMTKEMVFKFRRVALEAYLDSNNVGNLLSPPIIIAMKGHYFTGRKLIAFYVASILKCPLIKEHDFDNYEEKSEENQAKLWVKICNLALSQLSSGRSVVIDTELANQKELDQLKELSEITKTPLAVFECRMELAKVLWDKLPLYNKISDSVLFIFDEFMEKPTSQYVNSTKLTMGDIPIILVEQEDRGYFSWSVCSALMDFRAHIFPTFESQKEKDCDHLFKFTNIEDEHKRPCCQCGQLVSGSVYRCGKCRVILHPTCSYFPKLLKVRNPLLSETRTFYLGDVVRELDADASCNSCKQLIRGSTSSRYYSTEHGDVLFDLECLFLLPAKLSSKLHEHELVRAIHNDPLMCNECRTIIGGNTFCYLCTQCSISFDVYCLWLPEMVNFKRDRHPLKLLVFPRADPDPYFCHGCENERDADRWIYYCEDCDYHIHPRCTETAPCLPRYLSTEISSTNKKLKEKLIDTTFHNCISKFRSCISNLSTKKVMKIKARCKYLAKDIKLPIIIMMKGHSTLRKLVASILAETFDCLLIDEESLGAVSRAENNPKKICYREFSQIALSHLQIGLSIVIDCDFSHESEFIILRDDALHTETPLLIVEVKVCNEDRMQYLHKIVRSGYDSGNTPKISVNVTSATFDDMGKLMPHILHSISAYSKDWSKIRTKEEVFRSCYRHEIHDGNNYDHLKGGLCNRCSKKLSNRIFKCMICDLYLHKTCTKLPERIELRRLPFYLQKYGNDNVKVRCNCCNELVKDYAYVYSGDKSVICLDLNCLFSPSKPGINPHEHPLVLKFDFDLFQCGACGLTRKHSLSYSCGCGFKIGVKCGWLKDTVPFDRHRHSFNLIVSPEHVSNQYYCEVCQEERDKKHWVYACVGCEFFIHVRCLVPASCCPPSEL